jgi:hypothetical protein
MESSTARVGIEEAKKPEHDAFPSQPDPFLRRASNNDNCLVDYQKDQIDEMNQIPARPREMGYLLPHGLHKSILMPDPHPRQVPETPGR